MFYNVCGVRNAEVSQHIKNRTSMMVVASTETTINGFEESTISKVGSNGSGIIHYNLN